MYLFIYLFIDLFILYLKLPIESDTIMCTIKGSYAVNLRQCSSNKFC